MDVSTVVQEDTEFRLGHAEGFGEEAVGEGVCDQVSYCSLVYNTLVLAQSARLNND